MEKLTEFVKKNKFIVIAVAVVLLMFWSGVVQAAVKGFNVDEMGGRLELHDTECTQFANADGVASYTFQGEAITGCWKYLAEENAIYVIIEGILVALPAAAFTSP